MFNRTSSPENAILLARKSWVSYIPVLAIFFVFLAITLLTRGIDIWVFNLWGLSMVTLFCLYSALMIYSQRLVFDDEGVWLIEGFLPWNKGVRGIRWQDIDKATFMQGLLSWIFQSYSLFVAHKYTGRVDVMMTNAAHGDICADRLNSLLAERDPR